MWLGPVMAVDRSPSSPSPTYCTGRPIRRRYATVLSRRPRQRLTSVGCGVPARGSRYLGNRRCPRTPPTVRRARGHAVSVCPSDRRCDRQRGHDADFSIVFFLGAIFAIAEGLQRTGFTDRAAARSFQFSRRMRRSSCSPQASVSRCSRSR